MLTDNDLKSYIGSYYQDRKITYTKLDKHDRAIGVLLEENKKLHSIIKEVRKYIEENLKPYSLPQTIKDMRYIDFYKFLEILDKE